MVKVIKSSAELMKNRLSRRGYNLEDCKDLLNKQQGNLIYLNKKVMRHSNIKDLKRFC